MQSVLLFKLQVNFIRNSERNMQHILNTVQEHFKQLAEQFNIAYHGIFFSEGKKSAENLLYLPAKKITEVLKTLYQMIDNLILKISEVKNLDIKDCVEACRQSIGILS